MKNLIKKASLLTMLLLGIACISNAQVTVSFTLHIDDTGSPAWTGEYCAQVYVMEGNVQHCLQQLERLTIGDNLISYECYLPYSESDMNYKIKCTAWRDESPISFWGSQESPWMFFNYVTNGMTIVNVVVS